MEQQDDPTIYQLWEDLRVKCNRQHSVILKMLSVLDMEADWRDRNGRDSAPLRAITEQARQELSA